MYMAWWECIRFGKCERVRVNESGLDGEH
jgi:hypothetical protein